MKKRVLAIDYGSKRVGVAISRGSLAEPLTILTLDSLIFIKLQKICDSEKIDLILVGLSENKMAQETKKFAAELKKELNTPLEFVDETLSSKTVHGKLATSHMRKSKRQQPIDHFAAAEFLQEWLDG